MAITQFFFHLANPVLWLREEGGWQQADDAGKKEEEDDDANDDHEDEEEGHTTKTDFVLGWVLESTRFLFRGSELIIAST